MEFSEVINANGVCGDTESITMNINSVSLSIYNCINIFPLNKAVYSFQITHLILNENEITNLTKGDFKELINVMNLEIVKNNVSQLEENAFESLKLLTHLTIVEPVLRLKNLIFSHDCKLKNLHLELQSFDPQILLKLPKEMRNVTIENTPSMSTEFIIPNNLINLKYLRLSNCSMAIWNESEVTFSALEYLDLSYNKLKEIPLISEKFPKLLTLILSYNRISSIDEKAFESLRSLEILQLDNNKIQFVHPNAFSNNMNLAAVNLSLNSLTQISLNYTNFHKYQVDGYFNRLSCVDDTPSYLKTDVSNCRGINNKVIIISATLVIMLFISILMYRKRKSILESLLNTRGYSSRLPRHHSKPTAVTSDVLLVTH